MPTKPLRSTSVTLRIDLTPHQWPLVVADPQQLAQCIKRATMALVIQELRITRNSFIAFVHVPADASIEKLEEIAGELRNAE